VLGNPGSLTGGDVGLGSILGQVRARRSARDPQAFAAGRRGEPASQRGRITDLIDVLHQMPPDALADAVGVGVA
jgi:hypothetical protein